MPREDAGWVAQIVGDRAWAAELFVGADALLSALKQAHVEAGDAFRFLAAELHYSPGRRLTLLTPSRREAASVISYTAIEEAADAMVFFAFVWATLHAGGPLVAAGARVLVSANTWTPDKRKSYSPWRAIDGWIVDAGYATAATRAQIEAILAREWAIYRQLWPMDNRSSALSKLGAVLGSSRMAGASTARGLSLDLAMVRGSFRASGGSPTRAWLDGLLRRNPGLAMQLANLYGRYAIRAGFLRQAGCY